MDFDVFYLEVDEISVSLFPIIIKAILASTCLLIYLCSFFMLIYHAVIENIGKTEVEADEEEAA